ncbi:MAG: CHRD domain-containing protein [Candidatus Krumholzibacteriia bacterium]
MNRHRSSVAPGIRRPLGLLLAMLAATGSASAATVLTAVLDSSALASDSPAEGFARLVLDDSRTTITYEITYTDLQGEEFAAHIHSGPAGNFGAIIHHLPLGTPKIGSWEPSERRVAELLDGYGSVVIHTDLDPEGEIAGWLAVEGAPVQGTTWSAIKRPLR